MEVSGVQRTNQPLVTNKLDHIKVVLRIVLHGGRINLVVSRSDNIGRCNYTYHMIMDTVCVRCLVRK